MEKIFNQKLTYKDVLNIFIEQHRLFSPYDPEADVHAKLDFDSSVKDWRYANDLLPWYELYHVLNSKFKMSMPSENWKEILEPSNKRSLKDVCSFIADNSQFSDIYPKRLLGKDCLSASVFLELKNRLEKRKIQTGLLRPSSLITPYLNSHYVEFINEIILLSKGKRVFEHIVLQEKRKGFLNLFKFQIEKDIFQTEETLQTFRDLIFKIMECNIS